MGAGKITSGYAVQKRQEMSTKGTVSMTNTIEVIPENARWEIATKGLTGAYIAISNALKQAVGQKGFKDFNGPLWYQAGKEPRNLPIPSD